MLADGVEVGGDGEEAGGGKVGMEGLVWGGRQALRV